MKTATHGSCACLLAGLLVTASAFAQHPSSIVTAQQSQNASAAVEAYVSRTRELGESEFSVEKRSSEGNLSVYRITLRPNPDLSPRELRAFDVYVDTENAKVVGEDQAS